ARGPRTTPAAGRGRDSTYARIASSPRYQSCDLRFTDRSPGLTEEHEKYHSGAGPDARRIVEVVVRTPPAAGHRGVVMAQNGGAYPTGVCRRPGRKTY